MLAGRTWTLILSPDDIVDFAMQRRGRRVVSFSINYRAFVAGRWHAVWRQDTAHGRLHCHEPGRPVRFLEERGRRDYAQAFTEAERHISQHWSEYRRRWLDYAGP